jgi:hypothetical protein
MKGSLAHRAVAISGAVRSNYSPPTTTPSAGPAQEAVD